MLSLTSVSASDVVIGDVADKLKLPCQRVHAVTVTVTLACLFVNVYLHQKIMFLHYVPTLCPYTCCHFDMQFLIFLLILIRNIVDCCSLQGIEQICARPLSHPPEKSTFVSSGVLSDIARTVGGVLVNILLKPIIIYQQLCHHSSAVCRSKRKVLNK